MATNPTVIVGHLNNEELQKSIDALVANVGKGMQNILKSTNTTVEAMEAKLKSLGGIKIDGGGSANGGSSKKAVDDINSVIAAQDKQIKKSQEVKMSYDQMQAALEKATRLPSEMRMPDMAKSARDSYAAFMQGYKAQGETIARQIKDAEAALDKAVENRVNELNAKLANAKAKVNELNAELAKQRMNAEKTGNYSTYNAGITRTTQAIEYQMKHIAELQKKISEVSPNMFTQQVQSINELRKEQEKIANVMKEEVVTRQHSANTTQQQAIAEQKVTDEIHRQADEIRKSQQWKEKGFVTVNGRDIYNLEGTDTPRKNRISLEKQLLALQQQQKSETEATAQEKAKVVSQDERDLQIMGSQTETLRRSREILREMQAQKGGKVETFTPQLESAKRLSDKLKELREQYNNMTFGQRMSADGQRIAQEIREITRQTQKMNAELSRPANLGNALSLPAKNLDDIAFKMQQLRAYMRGLDMTNVKSANEVRTVTAALEELKRKENELLGKQAQLFGSNNALARSWNYMKNRLAFYFTVGASTQFVRNLIEVRSQYEMNERALGILVDSAERGTQIFNELSQMALVSPYTLIELSAAAKQLTAYDIAAKDVVDTTRRLADMASAVGIPIERLTYALGQIKAYGYLNSRDNRMFANAGIPLVKELADYYTQLEGRLVSSADVYDRIKKKAVSYEDTMQVINKMTDEGGRFFDFQAKMADTLKVQLANLTLAWNNMLNDIGESNQWLLSGSIGALKDLFLQWGTINRVIYDAAIVFGIAKAAQLALNFALGKGVASVEATILANKRRMATELERKALTQTLTVEEQRLLATRKQVTAADYQQMLASKSLTKQQAMLLYVMRGRNAELGAALIRMNILTAAELKNITVTKLFTAAMRSAWVSIKGLGSSLLAAFPALAVTTAIFSIVDAIQYYNEQSEKTAEMNKAIADNAREASKAMSEFISDSINAVNRQKALEGKLSSSDADKTWEALREQIELSSAASSVFIAKLLEEEDINKRIADGFDVAEKIRDATAAMAELGETALEVSQDSWLNGAFGEGLAEDLEDYIEKIKELREEAETRGIGDNAVQLQLSNKQVTKEAYAEMEAFADDVAELLREQLGDAGVADPVKLKEAVERIKKEVKAANPQIKGEVAKFFDVEVDVLMAKKFEGVYDKTASLHKMLIDHIKRDSGAALANLSDDILDTSKALDDDIAEAIEKSFKKLHDELPPEMDTLLSDLQKELDSNPLQVRYLLKEAGNIKERDTIQRDFDEHFIDNVIGEKPSRPTFNVQTSYAKRQEEMEAYHKSLSDWQAKRSAQAAKFSEFNKKTDEDRVKWAKRLNDAIKEEDAKRTAALHTMQEVRKELGKHLTLEQLLKDARYKAASDDEAAAKERMDNAKAVYDYEKLYNEEKKKNKGRGSQKDPLLDTLKQVVDIIKKTQSEFDTLTQKGMASGDALQNVYGRYSKTLTFINKQLAHYGLPQVDLSKIIKGKNPNDTLKFLQQLSDALTKKGLSKLERQKIIEVAVQEFSLKAQTFNLDKITKGLNSELGKLKDEYELAVAIDADPELGNAFADMMGINVESLPHTVKEYADQYSKYLNKYLEGKNSALQFTGDELRRLTRDDITAFREQVDAGSFNQEWFDAILKAYEDISGKRKKDLEDTEKWKNSLIEKYGNLQDKLTKIYKDSIQNQVNAVKTFGTEDQKSEIVRLQLRLEATDNPAELSEINTDIAKIVKDVTDKNPIALKLVNASNNQTKADTSKAYWEDFKNSELYAMTFEDMANNSMRAIQLIMSKLDALKDKVKEDPASMKALIKSLEDAEKELNARDPFGGIARSVKAWADASREAKNAQKELWEAEVDVEQAQQKVNNAKDSSPEEQKAAQDALAQAVQRRANAQVKLTQAENKEKKAQENLKNSLQGITNQLGNVQELFGIVSKLFRAGGDDETADAIDAISEGFTIMTTVIMGVVAAMIILESTTPWLLAIAAALSVVVGLVSFLSGNSDKKIVAQIEDSERAVKRLELAYIDLEHAVNKAYGMATIGANMTAKANKELQLVELKRQLALERSRESKNRDEDKIIDLQKQIKELEYDIADTVDSIVNDLLGISSVGDAMENMMDAFIEALRSGEDAMATFNENVDEMIANMVKKMFTTKILQPWFEEQWNKIQNQITKRAGNLSEERAKVQTSVSNARMADVNNNDSLVDALRALGFSDGEIHRLNWYNEYGQYDRGAGRNARLRAAYEKALQDAEKREAEIQQELTKATQPTTNDIRQYAELLRSGQPIMAENMQEIANFLRELGLMKDDANKNLSNLQQGISQITESTAEAIEAYMNSVSQQVYLHSDILTQIRDTVVGFDMDTQLGLQSQMLLQMQQSYQVQMSIENILQSVLNPTGRAFNVELIS